MQSLYLLKCQDFYKIGYSNNIKRRIKGMKTGNPYELEIIFIFEHNYAEKLEIYLHDKYQKEKVRGEWFALSLDQVNELKDLCLSFIFDEEDCDDIFVNSIKSGKKKCPKCGKVKFIDEFYKNKSRKNGHSAECKQCALEYNKKYRLNFPDVVRETNKRHLNKKEKLKNDTTIS